jgi:amidophosphoribosyltransferase
MADLFHECGIAAVYHLPGEETSPLLPPLSVGETSRMIPGMLLDIQNRGQLAAGMSSFNPQRKSLVRTHRDVGTVTEVFHLNHRRRFDKVMRRCSGTAAIGHVRYATCGTDERSYAQPFERHHIEKTKWFSFAFNGQLANYAELRDEILSQDDFHLARETDTEIIMHLLCREIAKKPRIDLLEVLSKLSERFDGAYNIVYLNALGDMFVARDPLGIRPLCYAKEGPLFAAASESVALTHMGFQASSIKSLQPGQAIIIENGKFAVKQFVEPKQRRAHCFFEWIYFANVASTLDDRSVYLSRKRLGEELANRETLTIDRDTIVVPVPDTAKAAADSMAYNLNVPSLEGLIRNRYVGRTFIEGTNRAEKVRKKYTPLPEVLEGKRVLLVEDTIVRSTTMRALVCQIKEIGRAREVHVRVACPPIIGPCFYGIDMSTIDELFAPNFIEGTTVTPAAEQKMADAIGADSLRYLPIDSIARCVDIERNSLCQACIDGVYPTPAGERLYKIDLGNTGSKRAGNGRTLEAPLSVTQS